MCARYEHTITDLVALCRELDAIAAVGTIPGPRWNIAPTTTSPIVRMAAAGARELMLARWGLVPPWATDTSIAQHTINARAETIFEKPAFRAAAKSKRCLVPATGWYEWVGPKRARMPVRIRRKDHGLITFAGLWERWGGPAGTMETFTIVTTDAAPAFAAIHDRMPVVLPEAARAAWLAPESKTKDVLAPLLVPYAGDDLVAVGADPRINRAGVDGAEFAGETPLKLPTG